MTLLTLFAWLWLCIFPGQCMFQERARGKRQKLNVAFSSQDQQIAIHSSASASPIVGNNMGIDSNLVLSLINKVAWGSMSSVEATKIAAQSYRDQKALLKRLGLSEDHASKSLKSMAGFGTHAVKYVA